MRSTRRRWPLALVLLAALAVGAYYALHRGPDAIDRDDRSTTAARDDQPAGPAPLAPIPLAPGGKTATRPPSPAPRMPTGEADGPHSTNVGTPATAPGAGAERGVVRDLEGHPVPDLEVVRTPGSGRHGEYTYFGAQKVFRSNGAEPHLPADATTPRATTAADGTFRFPYSHSQAYFNDGSGGEVTPASPEWMLPVASNTGAREILVEPAAWLSVRVVADEDGSAVPRFDARVGAALRGSEGFTATDGGFVVQWPRGARYEAQIDATVTIAAVGFGPETREVRIPADRAAERIDFRLKRSNDTGTLVVRLIDAPASLVARPFDLEIRAPAHPRLNVDRRKVTRVSDGTLSVDVPAGSWRVRLRPADGWANFTDWEQDLTIVTGQSSNFSWRVPPTGSIRIEVTGSAPRDAWLSLSREDRTGGASVVPIATIGDRWSVSHVPIGRWVVALQGEDRRGIAAETVEVRCDETALARLAAPSAQAPASAGK